MRIFQRQIERFKCPFILGAFAIHGSPAAGQLPIRASREIFERFNVVFGQCLNHLGCQTVEFNKRVVHTQGARRIKRRFVLRFDHVTGAGLQFACGVFVNTVDDQQLVHFDIGDFFEVGEPFGDQKLGKEFVQIQIVHEQLGAQFELGLTALALLLFGHDVDVQTGQLRCQTHVLTTTANRQRQLFFGNDDFDLAGFLVQNNLGDFSRLKRVHKEGRLVFVPRDNVDLLALKLVHNGLNAAAAHTNAGPHRVDGAIIRDDSDFRARTGVTGNGFDLDDAVIDFRHFHLEQLGHELGRCATQEDLRATLFAAHILDVHADTVVRAIAFAADFLVATQDRFASAHIDDNVAIFLALDQTVDDRAGAVLEFFVLAVTLGFADLLQDHLLGGLCGDTAHFNRWDFFAEFLTDFGVGHILFGLLYRELRLIVLKLVIGHNRTHTGKGRATGLAVDGNANVHLSAVARLRRPSERFFHRFNHEIGVDHLFAGHSLGGLQQFQLVGRCNGHLVVSLGGPFGLDVIEFGFVNRTGRFALAQHFFDQIVGQNQFGVGQPIELEPDGAFLDVDQHLVILDACQLALKAAAAVDQFAGLDLGFIALEHLEILEPRQRAVDAWARHFKGVFIKDRILDIHDSADGLADQGQLVHLDTAIGTVCHHLQRRRLARHQANAHQFKPHILDHRCDDLGHAAINGCFCNQVVVHNLTIILQFRAGTKKRARGPCSRSVEPQVWTPMRRC